jgi:hypothetical protein
MARPPPWSTPDERRELIGSEHSAAAYADALRSAGIPQRLAFDPIAFEVFAEVLAVVHGGPWELIA